MAEASQFIVSMGADFIKKEEISKLIKKHIREFDFVGRWGGEEFLIVLPKTDSKNGLHFANKLREVVEKSKFMYKETRFKMVEKLDSEHAAKYLQTAREYAKKVYKRYKDLEESFVDKKREE